MKSTFLVLTLLLNIGGAIMASTNSEREIPWQKDTNEIPINLSTPEEYLAHPATGKQIAALKPGAKIIFSGPDGSRVTITVDAPPPTGTLWKTLYTLYHALDEHPIAQVGVSATKYLLLSLIVLTAGNYARSTWGIEVPFWAHNQPASSSKN